MIAGVGQQLLATARERTPGMDTGQQRGDREDGHATFIYDEAGHGVEMDERLTTLLKDTDDDIWLLPAIALHRNRINEDDDTKGQRPQSPKRTDLICHEWDRDTTHQFHGTDDIPDATWSGQPIWEYQIFKAIRHGPAPDDAR